MAAKRVTKKQIKSAEVDAPPSSNKVSLFPRITRFITESWKLIATSFISGILLILIMIQAANLYNNTQKIKKVKRDHEKVVREIKYWKSTLGKYDNYRDSYFKIASLDYRVGNIDESKEYLKKALEIDPNFKDGYVLGAKVGL